MNEKQKRGRPKLPPFTEMEKRLILAIYAGGAIDQTIADALGMERTTFIKRVQKFPDLVHAIKATKARPNEEVKLSLFKLALGYEYTERVEKPDGLEIRHRHQPASVSACAFWLTNRHPEEWKALQHVRAEISKNNDPDFTPEELARIAAGEDPLRVMKDRIQQ